MTLRAQVAAQWLRLAPREKTLVSVAVAAVAVALLWWVALQPALATLRTANAQHRELDAQLQRMRGLQDQAQSLQSQPKQGRVDAMRLLEQSVRERLGTSARMTIAGERVTLTLTGTEPHALAQWLTQARINARALAGEVHLSRNPAGLWEGTLVLSLPQG